MRAGMWRAFGGTAWVCVTPQFAPAPFPPCVDLFPVLGGGPAADLPSLLPRRGRAAVVQAAARARDQRRRPVRPSFFFFFFFFFFLGSCASLRSVDMRASLDLLPICLPRWQAKVCCGAALSLRPNLLRGGVHCAVAGRLRTRFGWPLGPHLLAIICVRWRGLVLLDVNARFDAQRG